MKLNTLALLATLASLPTLAHADSFYHYHYKLSAQGKAPTTFSIEGFDSPTFASSCSYNSVQNTSYCEGDLNALSAVPHGNIFIRGGVDTGDIQLDVKQRCSAHQSLPLTGIPAVLKRDVNDPNGFFYDQLDAGLNPCRISIFDLD